MILQTNSNCISITSGIIIAQNIHYSIAYYRSNSPFKTMALVSMYLLSTQVIVATILGGRFELHCMNPRVEIAVCAPQDVRSLPIAQLSSLVIVGKLVYDLHIIIWIRMRRIDVSDYIVDDG